MNSAEKEGNFVIAKRFIETLKNFCDFNILLFSQFYHVVKVFILRD